jgi:hypothetical protein
MNLRDVAIGFVLGALLLGGASTLCYDKSVQKLQAYSAAHARSDSAFAQSIIAWSDSLRHDSDSLKGLERVTVTRVRTDTAAANLAARALTQARTARDSNVAYRLENEQLRRANFNLWQALELADRQRDLEELRGDSLQHAVKFLSDEIQGLNARIQALRPPSACGLGGTAGLGVRGVDAVAGFTCRVNLLHIL